MKADAMRAGALAVERAADGAGDTVAVTLFPGPAATTTAGEHRRLPWADVLARVADPWPWPGEKGAARGWTFAEYEGASRARGSEVRAVHGLMLDYDDERGVGRSALRAWWGRWRYVAHSSMSHLGPKGDKPALPRWRVALPFTHPVSPAESKRVGQWARHPRRGAGALGSECEDPARMYYAPTLPPTGQYEHDHNAGPLLDPSAAIAELERWEALDAGWRDPAPLAREESLPPFPVDALPGWLGRFVGALADSTQTPADMAGVFALAALAVPFANRARVAVTGGWEEPLNVYTMVAMPPASRKSAVHGALAKPIREFEQEAAAQAAPLIAEAVAKQRVLQAQLTAAEKAAAKGEAAGDLPSLAAELASMEIPTSPRYLADDVTPERLVGLMASQGGRIALMSDEGGIFETMAGRYSGRANLDAFLKAWCGTPIRVDRQGRPGDYVASPALTVALAVQPDVIERLSGVDGLLERGGVARFLMAWPQEDRVGFRKPWAPPMDPTTRAAYRRGMLTLLRACHVAPGEQPRECRQLNLSDGARDALWRFGEGWEARMRPGADLYELREWAGKRVGTVARLAGLFHLGRDPESPIPWSEPVSEEAVNAAVAVVLYLSAHARRCFHLLRLGDGGLAEYVLDRIAQRGDGSRLSKRDIHALCRGRCRRVRDLDGPLERLCAHGYLREVDPEPRDGPGRPAGPSFDVNPLWIP